MTSNLDLEAVGMRGFFRPVARVTLERGIEMVGVALARARELGLTDVVVNTLGFSGFQVPNVFDRYALALRMVTSTAGALHVAMVIRADLIDHQKIGALMAQNRGLINNVFATELEALRWLDSLLPPAGGARRKARHGSP